MVAATCCGVCGDAASPAAVGVLGVRGGAALPLKLLPPLPPMVLLLFADGCGGVRGAAATGSAASPFKSSLMFRTSGTMRYRAAFRFDLIKI